MSKKTKSPCSGEPPPCLIEVSSIPSNDLIEPPHALHQSLLQCHYSIHSPPSPVCSESSGPMERNLALAPTAGETSFNWKESFPESHRETHSLKPLTTDQESKVVPSFESNTLVQNMSLPKEDNTPFRKTGQGVDSRELNSDEVMRSNKVKTKNSKPSSKTTIVLTISKRRRMQVRSAQRDYRRRQTTRLANAEKRVEALEDRLRLLCSTAISLYNKLILSRGLLENCGFGNELYDLIVATFELIDTGYSPMARSGVFHASLDQWAKEKSPDWASSIQTDDWRMKGFCS